jgi:peptide/nickel transport system permease protein
VAKFLSLPVGAKVAWLWLGFVAFLAVFGQLLPAPDPLESFVDSLSVGLLSPGHFLGTDSNGYDMFSQLIEGSRYSVLIAVVSVGIGGILGSAIGISAAYWKGSLDRVTSAVFNVVLSVPNLLLALTLVSILATSRDPLSPVPESRRLQVVIISLTVVIIPILGRIARTSAMSWINREFVMAAKSMGVRDVKIIWRHIVPNVLPSLMSIGFLAIGVVIVAEGSLSLLGAGIGSRTTWGSMIARGRAELEFAPHMLFVPVVTVALTVISCNRIGDQVRRSLDRREARI